MSDAHVQLQRLLEVGRYGEARKVLSGELAERPDDPTLRVFAARIALAEDDPVEARKQLEQTLIHDPGNFSARYLLFFLELNEKHYPEAERRITDLIRDHPDDARLLASYADLMLRTLHLEKARALVDEALRLDPDDRDAKLTDVMLSTIEGQRSRAEVHLSDLVSDDPDGQEVTATLMLTLIDQNRPAEALEIAKELLRAQPENTGLVDLIVELRAQTHWLAWPTKPLQRFGWGGSAVIWLGAVVVLNFFRETEHPLVLVAALAYLGWVVYTWIYTPVMTRWLRFRGV